jgi:hypothetical protein
MSEEHAEPLAGGDVEDDGILDDLLGIEPDDTEAETEDQGQAPPDDEVQAPHPSRASRRVSALRNRLKDQEDENRRLRSDIEKIIAQTRQPAAPAIDPYRQAELNRLEQERIAMMQPHEIAAYTEQKLRNEFQSQLVRTQVETRDLVDRQMFETLKTRDKLAERFSDQVEQLLVAARNQGMNPTREILLNALVGQEIRQKAGRQTAELRRRGARQIAAQTTQPGGGRSSVAAPAGRRPREDSDEAFMERLRNTTVGDAW